jgi:PadR family transcriptional regulator, regulatory protein AphA
MPPHDRPPDTETSPTGRVILGMLAFGRTTGYDIKQFVDSSTRHFWAASYGQIYPELKRLEEAGLITGREEPTGDRPRTVYELTDDGRGALHTWLASTTTPLYELRDEGMLKLFFSDTLPERRAENIRQMRERHELKLQQLTAIQPHAATGPLGPRMTLELGLRITQCFIDWCVQAERRLANDPETNGDPDVDETR